MPYFFSSFERYLAFALFVIKYLFCHTRFEMYHKVLLISFLLFEAFCFKAFHFGWFSVSLCWFLNMSNAYSYLLFRDVCPSWQWHRTGNRWFPVRTLQVAPLWCDLGHSSRTVAVIKLRRISASLLRDEVQVGTALATRTECVIRPT